MKSKRFWGLIITGLLVLLVIPLTLWSVKNLRFESRKIAKESPSSKPKKIETKLKFKKGEIIVKFKEQTGNILDEKLKTKSKNNLQLTTNDLPQSLSSINNYQERFKIEKIEPVLKHEKSIQVSSGISYLQTNNDIKRRYSKRAERSPEDAKPVNLLNYYKITFTDKDTDILSVVNLYKKDPSVEYAEPNYIRQFYYTPNDQFYPIQYPLNNTGQEYPVPGGTTNHGSTGADISAPEAWNINKGKGVVVAVIDSGVDYNHPDLNSQMWINEKEIPGNGTDDDNNGYIDDIYGYDFGNNDNDPQDNLGHGTHCAGIIAAKQDNNLGISGIAPESKIMALKFADSNGNGSDIDAVLAINYAVSNGADILSNSWGGGGDSQLLREAIDDAFNQGVAVVVAAGNDYSKWPDYPAAYENTIAVAATDSNDRKADFSNYGSWVDIAAPGIDILSLRANESDFYGDNRHIFENNYYISSGTSMACPYVAGALALVISKFPDQDIHSICGRLLSTVDNIDGLNSDYQGLLGTGRLNTFKALTDAPKPYFSIQNYYTDPPSLEGGKSYSLKVNIKNNGELAENVSIELRTDSSYISVVNPTVSLNKIDPFSLIKLDFSFTALASLPQFDEINFSLIINYNSGQIKQLSIVLERTTPIEGGWPINIPDYYDDINASAMADLNNDGKQEIIFGTEANKIYVFSNEGELLPGWPFVIDNDAWSYFQITTGDINSDGLLEIVAVFDGGVGFKRLFQVYVLNAEGRTLSGWPFTTDAPSSSSPALGNLDNDDELEIVFGSWDGKLYVLNHDGTAMSGWPIQLSQNLIASSPTLGDIDKDGELEILIGCRDGKVYALNPDGSAVPGWPFKVEAGNDWDDNVDSTPSLGDINNDGELEIIFGTEGSFVYALKSNGRILEGRCWPFSAGGPGAWVTSSPALGDINLDGNLEIIFGSHDYQIYALSGDGCLLPGWPFKTGWYTNTSPALGNLDNDKELEIVTTSADNKVYAFNYDGSLVPGWPIETDNYIDDVTPLVGDIDNDGKTEVISEGYAWESFSNADFPGAIYWPKFKNDNYNTGLYKAPLCPTRVKGDLNCDNLINETDLSILLARWGEANLPTIETLRQNWKTRI